MPETSPLKPPSKKSPLSNASVSKVTSVLITTSLVSNESSHSNLRTQRMNYRAPSNEASHLTAKRNPISSSSNILMSSSSSVFKRVTSSRGYDHPSIFERIHLFEEIVGARLL